MIKKYMPLLITLLGAILLATSIKSDDPSRDKFDEIIDKAYVNKWDTLSIGDLNAKIALEFSGTPYVSGTLEGPGPEECRMDLTGVDCVTLYEYALGMARLVKKGYSDYDKLRDELTFMRYRSGKLDGYTSRLHYTSDWFADNDKKGVAENITPYIGGIKFTKQVNFMSRNPNYYDKLKDNPQAVNKISEYELKINSMDRYYIPKEQLPRHTGKLKTGDIIGITTDIPGLDYSHTGLVFVDNSGKVRLLHASSLKEKVFLDKSLTEYLEQNKKSTGVTIVRPLEPND
ncbi:MAG: N-acetylmuramoyl-L-alanine amidase-like domain-containing protein [Candidatus Kapaibacterium sp.]